MENKLNSVELELYSKKVARKLCSDFFGDAKQQILGKEILSFCSVQQINYFILKIIFQKWKEEVNHLKKSPFFNYEAEEVELAVANFANILSNYIVVKNVAFEQILATAVEEAMYLALSPYHYFKTYFFSADIKKITLNELREKQKYLKLNGAFFAEFVEKLETYKINTFFVSDIMGHLQESYYKHNASFDDYDETINQISRIVPMDFSKIVSDAKKKNDSAPTPLEIFENAKKEAQTIVSSNNINPIKLSLNQRIMFLKDIFKNDSEQMNLTMARLESAGNKEMAYKIIQYLNLDKENEVAQEFFDLIEAKYK